MPILLSVFGKMQIALALPNNQEQKSYLQQHELFHLIQKLMPIYDMDTDCSLLMKKLLVHRGVEIDDRAVFPFNQISVDVVSKAEALLDSVLEEYYKETGRS